MNWRVRFTPDAEEDLVRLYEFMLARDPADWTAAERALAATSHAIQSLQRYPFSFRKAAGSPFLREIVIPFGSTGYVALFEIEDAKTVTVLAVRHQREDDYH